MVIPSKACDEVIAEQVFLGEDKARSYRQTGVSFVVTMRQIRAKSMCPTKGSKRSLSSNSRTE